MQVLIVEPDHILAKEYKRAFESAKLSVSVCATAQDAIKSIDKTMPGAIVLELQLLGHSGIEFLHELRSYEDWASVPVFIHSRVPDYALGADKKTWSSFGVVRYFYKPSTSIQQLIGAVKESLK